MRRRGGSAVDRQSVRWMDEYLRTGRSAPKPRGGDRRSGRIEAQAELLMRAIDATPDITLAELRERLITERGETFALSTIHDFFRRHRITLKKKTAHAAEQQRSERAARRGLVRGAARSRPAKLVFIDETGATTKMARLYGRARAASAAGPRCLMAIGRPRPSSPACAWTASTAPMIARRPDGWRRLPGLCRAGARSRP